MEGRQNLRRLAITLRAVGLALIATSLTGTLLHTEAGRALAQQVMPVPGLGTPVPEGTPTPTAAPSATPPAAPASTPKPAAVVRGGPLTFRLSGSLSLGEMNSSSTRGDASTPGGLTTASQNQSNQNAGFMVDMERRTGASTLSLGLPLGISSRQGTSLGQVQAGYYTPHYGLQYMQQPVSFLGGVPMGSTLPGFSLMLPLHGGDASLYQGRTLIDQSAGARVYGARVRILGGRNLYELGLVRARRDDGQATVDSLIAGFASDNGDINQLFEGAWQRRSDSNGEHGVSALQYRLDYGSDTVYSTITARHVGAGFTGIGAGTMNADNQISGAFHTGPFDVQETFDRGVSNNEFTRSRQGAFSFFHQFGKRHPVSSAWNISEQKTQTGNSTLWLGSAGIQFSTNFGQLNTLFQAQGSRSTSSSAPPLAGMTYQATFEAPFGQYTAAALFQKSRQLGNETFNNVGQSQVMLSRQWGPTALTLADTFTHTITLTSDAHQTSPLLTLSRRLSPVIALALTYGVQTTRDRLNPSANGRSRVFNIQVTAPFSIGNGLVQGRANPRLPATITGMVINDIGDQGPFASSVSNGVNNVMVILDGVQMQRTDLSGRFQFNFVTPGHHTVQLQLASLPRGVTPDQPVAGIDVQGGQQGSVMFRIGTYGAIQGHVFARDSSGAQLPLAGVSLSLDKGAQISTTGVDGLYGFGRLTAGAHVVTVQTSSLPAMATLGADMMSQKIDVKTGQIATLDFTTAPLGSISGVVLFDQSLAPKHTGGVLNAYVVAEPGDYAAITNDDGSFLLDNMPAGTYTLDLDPETLPRDLGNISGTQTITLAAGANAQAARFLVGVGQKNIVFSLKQVGPPPPTVALQETHLPPGGATEVTLDGNASAKRVVAEAFGKQFPLSYDKSRQKWAGTLVVPLSANPGNADVDVSTKGPHASSNTAQVTIDPKIPLATFVMTPRHPMHGQYVTVQARFFADVHPGDQIRWLDGQITKLTHRLTGRVYQFTVKISVQPLRGLLLTGQGELPITLR